MISRLPPHTHKQEYPPLLAKGFHRLSVDAFRELCVTSFKESTVRADLMAGFESLFERALALGITGEVWMDGSFLTKKIDPGDIDFIFLVAAEIYDAGEPAQQQFIEWLISNEDEPKKGFFCHTDVLLVYQKDSPWRHVTEASLKHWEENVYGYSVSSHEPKGIVVIELAQQKKTNEASDVPT